jgi:hypothetical protein
MRWPTPVAIGLSLLAAACSHAPTGTDRALSAFGQFQDALFAGDATLLRGLVTEESAPVVDELPLAQIRQRQRLQAISASDERGSYLVQIRDPNQGNARGSYVVVRENGRFVVDLVATAAMHATPTDRPTDPHHFEPRELSPADLDRIRQRELATPPCQPVR